MEMRKLKKYLKLLTVFLLLLSSFSFSKRLEVIANEEESEGRVRFRSGSIILDFASDIYFGTHAIVNEDRTFYAREPSGEAMTHFVRIIDTRGSVEGWSLRVRQNGQLTASDASVHTDLIDAQLSIVGNLSTRKESVSGVAAAGGPETFSIFLDASGASSSLIAAAGSGEGAGRWLIQHGGLDEINDERINTNIRLFVPGTTPREAVVYTTTLTWYLVHGPEN